MTEEIKPTEMVETEQTEQKPAEMVSISAAELDKIRKALKDANTEAAKHRKAAEQFEAEQKAKAEAEMTAVQKAEARAKAAEERAARLERESLQKEIAAKVGLPAKLATRLQGETAEELEADAKAILEDLPKPPAQKPQPPGIVPINPGSNGSTGETDAARRARLGF